MKKLLKLVTAATLVLFFSFAYIGTARAAADKAEGFVCPVIKTDAVLHSPKGDTLGDTGDYTIGGPDVSVPIHATNGDGAGVPAGPHSSPGDTDYTAVWSMR